MNASEPMRMLYRYLDEKLSLADFVELCRSLGEDADNFAPNDSRRRRFLELQQHLERRGRLEELVSAVAALRPDVDLTHYGGPPPAKKTETALDIPTGSVAPEPVASTAQMPPIPDRLPYEDFDIYVQSFSDGRYSVEVTDSPVGQSQRVIQAGVPLADAQGEQWLADLRSGMLSLPDAEAMGRVLYAWLFPEPIANTLFGARTKQRYLRLRLRLDPPEISRLPWEFVCHPTESFLVLNRELPFVRYTREQFGSRRERPSGGIRLLAAAASPANSEWPPLDVEAELRQLRDNLGSLTTAIHLRELPHVTRTALQDALIQGVDALHFVGHGKQESYPNGRQLSSLIFEGEDGEAVEEITADMMRFLIQGRDIKLVMLNACQSAQSESQEAAMGLAPALVRVQVPAVIAMQARVSDRAARRFSRTFYRLVAQGHALDTAVTEMRLATFDGQGTEWGTPVLFMRDFDGLLWDPLPSAAQSAPVPNSGVSFSNITGSTINIGGSVTGGNLTQGR